MIYAYWFMLAALVVAQVLGYISLSVWTFVILLLLPLIVVGGFMAIIFGAAWWGSR